MLVMVLFPFKGRNFTVQPIDVCKPAAEASKPARPHNGLTGLFNPLEGIIMKTRLSLIAVALSTFVAGHAMAADPVVSKTRAEVRAELIEAQRTGNIVANGETGMLLKDLYPSQYPSQATVQAKSRDDVRAELIEAQRTGKILAHGETGMLLKDLYPSQYPSQATVQAKSRDDVRAELIEAQRTGNILANGDSGMLLKDLYPSQYPTQSNAQGKSRVEVLAEVENARNVKAN
jgi:hypothetical protein